MSKSILENKQQPKIQMLNTREANELFENTVRSHLGISSDEFMERYRRGEYKGACNNAKVLKLLMMIPKNR